jgi:hypothetical protein
MIEMKTPKSFSKSIQINGEWASLILSGKKTVETSGQSLCRGGKSPGWLLLRDESGNASGAALFSEIFEYKNREEFDKDYERHLVGPDSGFYFGNRKRTFGYQVIQCIKFKTPVKIKTPAGQCRKKKLDKRIYPN